MKIRGFTLIEVLLVVALLILLAALALPHSKEFMERAREARCLANMRGITLALHSHLQDHAAVWPQGPSPNQEREWEDFWLACLAPYGIDQAAWQCPTFNAMAASSGVPAEARSKIHYIPTVFGPEPKLAYRWTKQPWLIERTSVHQHGAHICFQDGSVKSFNKLLAEHGVR